MAAILLIEDDPHQRAFAAMVLAEAGHQVREAPEGQEALRLALADPPELIVCDVVMPGMNGYQLVSAVRREPAICTTPVILLTSLAGRAQVRVGMTAGADDYLPKPFQPAELLEAVDALLQRRKTQYDAIAGSLMQDMDAALEQQREVLAARYESQLLQEINGKWKADVAAGGELAFAHATLLVADLFSVVERDGGGRASPADLFRRAHEAAGDALYLFGAAHVLHHGQDVIGVFPAEPGAAPDLSRPLRAAFALQSAAASVLGADTGPDPSRLAIALDVGPVSLLRLQDPLHGDAGLAPVPGPTLQRAQAVRGLARTHGWAVAAMATVAQKLPADVAAKGRSAAGAGAADGTVTELLRPRG